MALITTITPMHVALALGQPAPPPSSVMYGQWALWLDDALMFVQDRADKLDITDIDQVKIDYVIREVVADQVRRKAAEQDPEYDGRTFRTVADWWPLLGLSGGSSGAFSFDTVPLSGTHLPWCSLNFGATYCSCGTDIAGTPIYEIEDTA